MKTLFTTTLLLIVCLAACEKENLIKVNQETYPITGNQFFPEGIAYDAAAGFFYTGSTNNGDILSVNVRNGETLLFARGADQGRSFCTGMKLDTRNRLWVCGGPNGNIFVLNKNGSLLKSWDVKTQFSAGFVNDCVIDTAYIYFTDSQTPKIYRIKSADEQPGNVEEWTTFTNAQVPFTTGTNANGIESTPDGQYLIIVVSSSGKLYRIDKATKAVVEIQLNEPVPSGDGLLLDGKTLYVSRNATGKIFPVTLSDDYSTGTVGEGFGENLLFNTTMAKAENYLLVVNGQLNKRSAPSTAILPFYISRVAIP